jgi:uncharacterized protein YjiS (DUF1127 family)
MHRQHQMQHPRLEAAIEFAVHTARSIWKWLRAGRARREIQGLSDRMLKDIGVKRSGIDRLFR